MQQVNITSRETHQINLEKIENSHFFRN